MFGSKNGILSRIINPDFFDITEIGRPLKGNVKLSEQNSLFFMVADVYPDYGVVFLSDQHRCLRLNNR